MQKAALVIGISFHRGPTGEPGRGLIYQELQEMDETVVSLHSDPVGAPGEGMSIYWELCELAEGGHSIWSISLYGRSVIGTWREGSFAGDPEGYVEKALETGIPSHRGPNGNLVEGSCTRDFERGLNGALRMGTLSLKRLREKASRGASFTRSPGRC
jgi:hypothetical protein